MLLSDDDNDQDAIPLTDGIDFDGFDKLYGTVLKIEDQLMCPDVQAEAGESYGDLKNAFDCFQKMLRRVTLDAKRKKMKNLAQMTLHDMFEQSS